MKNNILESVLEEKMELEERCKKLEEENQILKEENYQLSQRKEFVEKMISECEETRKQFNESMELAKDAKKNYEKLFRELSKYKK